jgi:hypothetical protein
LCFSSYQYVEGIKAADLVAGFGVEGKISSIKSRFLHVPLQVVGTALDATRFDE